MRLLDPRTAAVITTTCGLFLAPFLASSQAPSAERRGHGDDSTAEEIEEAAELFRSSCSTCHLPPDPDHATDLAWLNQVTDTA